ncbi:DNA-binding protein [Nocardiopsis gilva YIM 90087]|uniref:DNA-binding protein n=1 Tax=Nocardiopsis gilva YIM 90087 TaxID=1235441 RepID=A0A223S074_9ACTN|nr:helix-turn-helix domain-containing protein [Nocardiopsis gilva]ASU81514.1 DNA-binding protein [Nocardiopsis gilva YIM 90087]
MLDHPDPRHRWYTKDEAAEAAGVSVRTVNRWIAAGLLTVRLGHINAHLLFEVEAEQRARRHRGRPGARLPA